MGGACLLKYLGTCENYRKDSQSESIVLLNYRIPVAFIFLNKTVSLFLCILKGSVLWSKVLTEFFDSRSVTYGFCMKNNICVCPLRRIRHLEVTLFFSSRLPWNIIEGQTQLSSAKHVFRRTWIPAL